MTPLQCLFCDRGNPADAKFCNECGTPVHFKPCPQCDAVNGRVATSCHRCGAEFSPLAHDDEVEAVSPLPDAGEPVTSVALAWDALARPGSAGAPPRASNDAAQPMPSAAAVMPPPALTRMPWIPMSATLAAACAVIAVAGWQAGGRAPETRADAAQQPPAPVAQASAQSTPVEAPAKPAPVAEDLAPTIAAPVMYLREADDEQRTVAAQQPPAPQGRVANQARKAKPAARARVAYSAPSQPRAGARTAKAPSPAASQGARIAGSNASRSAQRSAASRSAKKPVAPAANEVAPEPGPAPRTMLAGLEPRDEATMPGRVQPGTVGRTPARLTVVGAGYACLETASPGSLCDVRFVAKGN